MLGDEELDDLDKVISANLLTYRGNHSDETIAECYVLAKLCEEAAKARPQQRAGSKRGTSPPTISLPTARITRAARRRTVQISRCSASSSLIRSRSAS